ncbi:MAG: NAD+ synthase [Gemmatimonadales bacterium]|nr:NAD+ synthase [Gemmatimonadales bacterium]
MLRLAIAQFRPRKAAYRANLEQVGQLFRDLARSPEPVDVLVLPETALTGYFVEGGVRELAVSAEQLYADLSEVHAASGAAPVDVIVGFYELWNTRLYNSGLAARLGGSEAGICHVHRKVFLPTYGVFDEERFVEPGRSVQAFDLAWGRAAIVVCEDAWHSIVPTMAALDGAQVVVVLSASPARGVQPGENGDGRPASTVRWERVAQAIAAEHGLFVVVAHLVGFEGGKAFPGGSLVVDPRGGVVARAPIFEDGLTVVTVDLDEVPRTRAEEPMLSDLETHLPHLLDALTARRQAIAAGDPSTGDRAASTVVKRAGAVPPPAGQKPLEIDPELTERWLVEFLKDEVNRRRGFERVVLGLSGGVDSAVVAYLAARAFGPTNVTAVRMPYRTSSPASLNDAQLVIDALGLAARTVDISAGVDGLVGELDPPTPGRLGNVMARMRMITLFDLAASLNGIPLGTGNKTERLFGYFTWHADDSPPVNPIGDLFKTQVWALARHLGVPLEIVDKPPTADLVAGQTDEGDFGISYAKADQILHWTLSGYPAEAIESLGFSAAEIALVRRRLDSTHWKRKLPTVAMLSPTAIGEFYLRPVDY